ncbi:MAG: hypothetical protein FJ147_03070 [Deltaproteobacteria bacterium]|nr:hypothetical protein [Deltaproteobacteria bacterium]
MIDRTHAGLRCHTRHLVRTVKGDLPRESHGTIVYEMENLGRQLILVNWDSGIAVPVFPDEIEIENQRAASH